MGTRWGRDGDGAGAPVEWGGCTRESLHPLQASGAQWGMRSGRQRMRFATPRTAFVWRKPEPVTAAHTHHTAETEKTTTKILW